ncbi:MAG: hypothetical protein HY815_30705 [Candidatus Riflebacteria bacterium]|nr:hypothetical protein [Candidatus Riflebacteria bacterium]
MRPARFKRKVQFSSTLECTIRLARTSDVRAIRTLYDDIYGGDYPLPIIRDPTQTLATIKDRKHFWLVVEHERRLVASVIFAIDSTDLIGRVSGAVVRPEFRGHDLTHQAIRLGLEELLAEKRPLDLFYATTRTVTPAPERLVSRLGFVSCGVFPNVHKVVASETHGLNAYFRPQALKKRLLGPRLIPEVGEFFAIAKETLNLPDDAVIEPADPGPRSSERFEFSVVQDEAAVAQLYRQRIAERSLKYHFFPFHEPQVLYHTPDQADEVFIHFNRNDGYGAILGVKSEVADFGSFLDQLCEAARDLGLRYLELLISAFDPMKQRHVLTARFLPCAYFPAMKVTTGDRRMDYLIFSRSFENLDFTGIALEGTARRYLQAFMKCWYAVMVAQAPDFEQADRLFSS